MKTKLTFSYYNQEFTIDISSNEHILSLIENKINKCKQPDFTIPNNEVDDIIRNFVDGELKKSEIYRGMGHADKFLIYNESNDGEIEKLHAINGSFSNEKVQEIIKKIKEKY